MEWTSCKKQSPKCVHSLKTSSAISSHRDIKRNWFVRNNLPTRSKIFAWRFEYLAHTKNHSKGNRLRIDNHLAATIEVHTEDLCSYEMWKDVVEKVVTIVVRVGMRIKESQTTAVERNMIWQWLVLDGKNSRLWTPILIGIRVYKIRNEDQFTQTMHHCKTTFHSWISSNSQDPIDHSARDPGSKSVYHSPSKYF